MDNIFNSSVNGYINKLYDKSTYLDKYGGSVIVTCVTLFFFFLIFSYFFVMSRIKPIKADWVNQKCAPIVIPFAGIINASPGESKFEYTANNFSECVTSILAEIIGYFTQPIHFLSNITSEFFAVLGKAIQKIRELFNRIRKAIMSIVENVMNRITNVLIQLQVITMKIKNVLGRTQALLTSGLYTIMASYLAMKSFFGAMLEIVIAFLVMLASAVILAWIFPWTWPFAAAATAVFVGVAIPTGIMAGWLGHILELTSSNIPNSPAKGCFDESTIIETSTGGKKIIDIKLGDILKDNGIVTSLFKIKRGKKKIYLLDNVLVTGCHDVFYNGKWLPVSDHPERKEITDYKKEFVYCLNTTNKNININNTIFADWDEVDKDDINDLSEHFPDIFKKSCDIHKYLEGGFDGDTKIELFDGSLGLLKDLEIGDIFKSGDRVVGIVKISTNNILHIKKYNINNSYFIGGPNLAVKDNYLGNFNTYAMGIHIKFDKPVLYQVITDSGMMTINGVRFFDYNGGLEQILWQKKYIYDYL
jgi:hypothetical protein